MLLIEKVVKLLDDFHFGIFREHVKNISLRSYYPLALIDVIDRDVLVEQSSEELFRKVYGEEADGEKDLKKFFQLAHYTFKLTNVLARNYPDYLQNNISRVQQYINEGQLEKGTHLAEILQDVCEKVEDISTEINVSNILAQKELLLQASKESLQYFDRIQHLAQLQSDMNNLNHFLVKDLKNKGKEATEEDKKEKLAYLEQFVNSPSFSIRMIALLNTYNLLYLYRDPAFYAPNTYEKLLDIEEQLQKYDYIIFPFLHNLRPRLAFLKLNYSIQQLSFEEVLAEAARMMEDSEGDLFWNSFINLPELSSIAIQTSHFVSTYFTSYRPDHLELIPEEVLTRLEQLRRRCRIILDNRLLEEKFVVRYINLSTIYGGLLLLGDKKDIKECVRVQEGILSVYQQVAFHASIDPIYTNLIMANFCLEDYEQLEKSYRRYKKSTKGKTVNPENDLTIHAYYYAAKWRENGRNQYIKKLRDIIEQTYEKHNLERTRKNLLDIVEYYKIPVPLANMKNI
ncbi:hypothetical protein [Flavilitoribacter nigricans]|uniref:Uncharacterized protein n=1 Tax=Flavilitoribacter nigricans (strain ATCC 23147 / DSM 23189 / NBRC 102662 / NCIMB 1420 / SS-2) TaxID=1122177 RepID=A0A2D0NF27_FLAN2|nr:hypothetical protein [Flavilitoribacter nigricans]PHN07077.1 hypothetical protein CRP01_07545 [Flavilitoribacter nigricans DSM 23189 = NBRC 102662]